MNVVHSARAAIIESEASKKRRSASRAITRTATSLMYEPGDIVYFKPENSNHLKGPDTVIARENKQILVKYGETYLRVHASRLQHVKDVKMLPECETQDEKDQTNITTAKISKNETFEIYNENGLSTTFSDTIINYKNNQTSHSNSQNIPNEVTSNCDNTEDEGQKVISVRWKITKKNRDQKLTYKAHLVAPGFEELDRDNIRTDSPTCCKENFTLVLTIIVSQK